MLSGRILPAHPHPLPNELFTSWLTRLAQANGIKVHSLALHLWDRRTALSAWARDLDKTIDESQLLRVAEKTGLPYCQIRGTTLRRFEGITQERVRINTGDPLILPCGVHHRTKTKNWLVYCPRCLRSDETPYFRLEWRLAMYTVCPTHETQMLDHCPECKKPINFVRGELGQRFVTRIVSMCVCSECGFDLRSLEPSNFPYPDNEIRTAHRQLLRDIYFGKVEFGNLGIGYSPLFFPLIGYLSCFLRSTHGRRIAKLLESDGVFSDLSYCSNTRSFSEMTLTERHRFQTAVLWLLWDWPSRFKRYFIRSKLAPSKVTRGKQFPYWFQSVLCDSFYHNSSETRLDQIIKDSGTKE